MAPDFYFFTDANLIAPSTLLSSDPGSSAFGPAGTAAGKDQYRISSLHKATANPTAYAVCDGIVYAQRIPTTSATMPKLLNVILKPLVQPGLNFAPIKYFIYKGILEDSLINGTEVAPAATSDLTKAIWDDQKKVNDILKGVPLARPSADVLEVGVTAATAGFADEDPIDNLFYPAQAPLYVPVVKGGWSIGQFAKDEFGLDVLMEGLGFRHTMSLTRTLENMISVPSDTSIDSVKDRFEHAELREQMLGYMDACAFYGSFFRAGILAKKSTSATFERKSGNDLYHDVLSVFANKNVVYLDIRNEHNLSLNYFTNYGDSIQFSGHPGHDPLVPIDHAVSGWPLLTLDASSFPTDNTTKARNPFRIQLPVGDNPKPLLYVSQGYRDINGKRTGFPEELTGAERFYDMFDAPVQGFTATPDRSGHTSMTFVVPNVTGQSSTTPVSCYIRLKYLKQEQGVAPDPAVIQSAHYLDNLFYPIDLRIPFKGTGTIRSFVYDEEAYVNALGVPELGFDGIAKVGIARDADNTSLFLTLTSIRQEKGPASTLVTLTGEISDYTGHYPNLVALKYPLERVVASAPTLSASGPVPLAQFASDGDAQARSRFNVPDFDKFFVIVVSNTTYDSWRARVEAAGANLDKRFRIYLGVKALPLETDGDGVEYAPFELVLRGYEYDASAGHYTVRDMNTDPDLTNSTTNVKVYAHARP